MRVSALRRTASNEGKEKPAVWGWFGGGFASPPQLDLYMETEYYKNGKFTRPPFTELG